MTTIGILGSGHVGSNLARAAIAHGYDVVLSNSQGPETIVGLAGELGPKARAATPAEAATAADFAIVATPLPAIGRVPVEPLAGKVVIAHQLLPAARRARPGDRRRDYHGPRPAAGAPAGQPGGARLQHDQRSGDVGRRPPGR